jgi:two-component system phosphate regulon sensor histidine kinase PhoR
VTRSLYWKLTLPLVLLIALIMTALGVYVVGSSRNAQLSQLESQLANEAKLVADLSAQGFGNLADNSSLRLLARTVGAHIGARVTLIALDGTVIGDSDQDPSLMGNHSGRPEVIAALNSGVGEAIRYSATLHQSMMYVAVPVAEKDARLGIARVAVPLTVVEAADNRTTIAIVLALIGAALLVIIALAALARMITRPVRRLTLAAEEIASGHLDQQIRVQSGDEIGRLGRAFNNMSLSVKSGMAAVSDERNRLKEVLNGLTDGVILTDSERVVALANPAAASLFGGDVQKITGKRIIEAIHDHEVDNVVRECLEQNSERSAQLESTSGRFLRVVAVPITAARISGALVLLQDLTELRGLQTMRKEFVGNISHELRTPLAAMKAIVETLRDGAISDERVAGDFLDRLEAEVEGMTQMATEIIELSRIESGATRLILEPFDLNALIGDVITRLSPQADRKGLSVTARQQPDLPPVLGDRDRIQQVALNILHNAIKFTPAGGSVTAATSRGGDTVIVEISDTGVGISQEDLPHIFERFFKADRSRASGGTGLGLAIAKHIVQAHGGSVWVRSKQGAGSTFGFSLPISSGGPSMTVRN